MGTVSGLSAAHTIYLAGGNVLLLDKNSMYTLDTYHSLEWAQAPYNSSNVETYI